MHVCQNVLSMHAVKNVKLYVENVKLAQEAADIGRCVHLGNIIFISTFLFNEHLVLQTICLRFYLLKFFKAQFERPFIIYSKF